MMDPLSYFVGQQSERVLRVANSAADHARKLPGAGIVEGTMRAYSEDRCSVLAAALSYYTLLSLFPLMLFILGLASLFVQSEPAIRDVTRFMESYLPIGNTLIRSSLEEVTRLRGPLTVIGAVGFLWSSSGVFDLVQLGLNRAFCVVHARPIWRQRMVSLGMVIGICLLFGLSFLMTTAERLAIHYRILERHNFVIDTVPPVLATILGIIIFGLLYRYIPFDPTIRWKDIWLPALLAAVLWEAAKLGFAWYLTNMATLNFVYGSVGAIIALMLWGYLTAAILLGGAELAAVASGARQRVGAAQEWRALQAPTEEQRARTSTERPMMGDGYTDGDGKAD